VANWPDYNPRSLLGRLVENGVDFVIVGGMAVILQASPRFTKDLDICYSPAEENLDSLGEVLLGLDARLRGIDEEVPFIPDGRTLRGTQILCLSTSAGDIDLLVEPDGAPRYEALRRRADVVEIDGHEVRVASIEDLLAMKRAAGRPQDLVDIESLEAAQRLRRRLHRRGED
jgi:predicted nucleotidyltransferase